MITIDKEIVALAVSALEEDGFFLSGEFGGPALSFTEGEVSWYHALQEFGCDGEPTIGVDEDEGNWIYFIFDEARLGRAQACYAARRRAEAMRSS